MNRSLLPVKLNPKSLNQISTLPILSRFDCRNFLAGLHMKPISLPPFLFLLSHHSLGHGRWWLWHGRNWMCFESSSYLTPLVIQVTGMHPSTRPSLSATSLWMLLHRRRVACPPSSGLLSNAVITRNWFPLSGQQELIFSSLERVRRRRRQTDDDENWKMVCRCRSVVFGRRIRHIPLSIARPLRS